MAIKDNVQGVVLALFGASAGGHLAGLTASATANGLTAVAADLAASAGFILGKDLSTAAAFRDNMLTGLGISSTNSAYAAAAAWADGELAKAGANRGEIVASAVNFLAGLTDATSPFYAVATAYRATVTSAVTWSEGAGATVFGVAALQAQQGNGGAGGTSFTLKEVTDMQDFSAFAKDVNVTVNGDNNANDGTDFNVVLTAQNDTLSVIEFRNMTADGGAGTDTLDMSDSAATVNVQRGEANFDNATDNVVEFKNFEVYKLSDGSDTFTGGVGNDKVIANGGDDELVGGAGNDTFVFVDTDQLGEINTAAIEGGIGTDTLEIGVLKTNTGYEVDLLAENTVSFGTDIEVLKVTGVSDRDSGVHTSTIKVDDIAGFKTFVGATSTDKLNLTTSGAADLSTWSFTNIREVSQDSGANTHDLTVKQAQLNQVARWVGESGANSADITLKAETGAASQTFDLTKNYFKDFASLNEASDIKTTVVADSKTIAGFAAMGLTTNDTLQVIGDADLSSYDPGTAVTLKFDGAITLAAADWATAGNFKKITGTGDTNQLTIDTSGGAIDASGLNFAGVKTLVTTGSATNAITLSATSVYTEGLQLKNAGPLTLDATGRSATTDYATFNALDLVGTSKKINLVGDVGVAQSLLSTATELDAAAAAKVWVAGDADFTHIITNDNTNVSVQDTKADNEIIGMSAAGTYAFSKGGDDTFTGAKDSTITASATSGSLVASLGNATNSVTLSKAQALTATFAASGDHTLDVQNTSTGNVDATFETLTKAVDSTPTITLDLHGKGTQTVVIGDILSSAAATGVVVDLGGEGDIDLTVGQGFADIDIDTAGSGDITIVAADGGHTITTSAEQTGFLKITVGKNLDAGLTTTGDGAIDISDATGGSEITVGAGGWAITGGTGRDVITAGSGNDTITAGIGADTINLSAGGYDTLNLETSGSALTTVTAAATVSMATFSGYAAVTGFAIGATAATGDNIDGIGTDIVAFSTDGIDDDTSAADVYLYTGTLSSLLNVSAIIDAIGDVTGTGDEEFYIAINNTAGTQFGLYHVVLGDDVAAANLDDATNVGGTIELVGVINGALTATNADEVFV